MFTRCTGCHTTHPVNASLLARAGGKYRCGKCQKTGNALDALFDEWPNAGDRPPETGDIPVLGLPIDLDKARKSRLSPDEAALTGDPDEVSGAPAKSGNWLTRTAWIVLALAVIAVTVFEIAKFQEIPLAELPLVDPAMVRLGLKDPPVAPVFRDLDQIQLASRELVSHPFKDGTLQLTATIVNRASQSQPYPDLEIILLDSSGERVSQALFSPDDYLASGKAVNSSMAPEAFLPLTLELPDPGNEAVGFELNFR